MINFFVCALLAVGYSLIGIAIDSAGLFTSYAWASFYGFCYAVISAAIIYNLNNGEKE